MFKIGYKMFTSIYKITYKNVRLSYRHVHKYIFKMDKAYLRHLTETDQFQITFTYKNPEKKVDRQFNFSRQISETAHTFLSRVSTNVEKVINKKNKRKKTEEGVATEIIDVGLYLNDNKVNDDVVCKDLFTDENKVVLKIINNEFKVIVNSPYVEDFLLPSSMLANFPVYPRKFEAVNTDRNLSDFVWYRSIDKINWEQVGCGFMYTPNNLDVNYFLKLSCLPKNAKDEGPIIESVTGVTVSASPGFCPFENRHQFTKEKCGSNEFRVVSYNILADLYCDSDFTRTVLHPYCPPYALEIDYRKQLILKEVIGYNADIICLQEVDKKIFKYEYEDVLSATGYDSHFTLKGATVAEGVACFYNNEKFRLLSKDGIILSSEINTNKIYADIWAAISASEKLSERFLERQTAAQITTLECTENGNILLVANTHLYFHPDADHIRLLQGGMCIKYVEDAYNKIVTENPDKVVSVIFCGDFNSVPECGIYKLYTTGQVGSDCIDWESNKEEAVKNLSLSQPLKLSSACGTPKYTNYTVGFADCLDYIFYDTTNLKVSQVVPLPSMDEITQNTALPSIVFPSDHISLVADLKWNK